MTTAEGRSEHARRTGFGLMRDVRQGAWCALVTVTVGIAAQLLAPVLVQSSTWEPYEAQAVLGLAALLIAFSFLCDGLRAEKRMQRKGRT